MIPLSDAEEMCVAEGLRGRLLGCPREGIWGHFSFKYLHTPPREVLGWSLDPGTFTASLSNASMVFLGFFCFLFKSLFYFFEVKFFMQFLKFTFHLQLLQSIGCIPCVVQYILEPVLHPIVCTPLSPTPISPPSTGSH